MSNEYSVLAAHVMQARPVALLIVLPTCLIVSRDMMAVDEG